MSYLSVKDFIIRFKLLLYGFNHKNKLFSFLINKSIAIVGNAESLLGTNFGDEIDSHDIIIRFNNGYIKNKTAQGCKTHVWASSLYIEEDELQKIFPDIKFVIWMTPKLSLIKTYSKTFFKKVSIYPFLDWYMLYRKIKQRPTSGLMLIDYLVKNVKYKNIDIYGFDFFKTNSFYNQVNLEILKSNTPHNFNQEENYVKELMRNNPNIKLRTYE